MTPLLIDMDGVLRISKSPAPFLAEFICFIEEKKIPAAVISNSTLSNAKMLKEFFNNNSIETRIPVITAADASLQYLSGKYEKVAVYCSEPVRSMFSELTDYQNPQAVLIGDMGKNWTFEILNEIFRFVQKGAELIAMQKNRYWSTPEDGLLLDAGAFVAAIEYATGREAILIGKPSPIYFKSGLKTLGYEENTKFLMLGDDVETDIQGANNLNSDSILIYTGKTKYPHSEQSLIVPTYEAMNLKEVVVIIEKYYGL